MGRLSEKTQVELTEAQAEEFLIKELNTAADNFKNKKIPSPDGVTPDTKILGTMNHASRKG